VGWKKALILWLQDKVEILEYHNVSVSSPQHTFRLPSVIRLKVYIRPYLVRQSVKLSRQNVFLRDQHTCQYCGIRLSDKKLTIDHVLPLSKGGRHSWENVVAACAPCNNKKGDRTPEQVGWRLLKSPKAPRWLPNSDLEVRSDRVPEAWQPYLLIRVV